MSGTVAKIEKTLNDLSKRLLETLAFAFLLSLFAEFYYLFDLFSHFALQYAIGGFVLTVMCLRFRRYLYAAVAIFIAIFSIVETRLPLQDPWQFSAPKGVADYRLVTYNHNFGRNSFERITDYFLSTEGQADIVVLQEATDKTVAQAEALSTVYPYQIHQPRDDAFGMMVMSQHEFLESEKIILKGPYYTSFAFRVVIQPPEAPAPITVYALHPHPPTGPVAKAQREYELQFVAERIAEDSSENIVMMGDWNITPFSPYFKDVLDVSGLNFQAYGFMQNPTWLSINGFKFLKIPIDHMLFSDGLSQMNKYAGPTFMSDHHMLIGEYVVKD